MNTRKTWNTDFIIVCPNLIGLAVFLNLKPILLAFRGHSTTTWTRRGRGSKIAKFCPRSC